MLKNVWMSVCAAALAFSASAQAVAKEQRPLFGPELRELVTCMIDGPGIDDEDYRNGYLFFDAKSHRSSFQFDGKALKNGLIVVKRRNLPPLGIVLTLNKEGKDFVSIGMGIGVLKSSGEGLDLEEAAYSSGPDANQKANSEVAKHFRLFTSTVAYLGQDSDSFAHRHNSRITILDAGPGSDHAYELFCSLNQPFADVGDVRGRKTQ